MSSVEQDDSGSQVNSCQEVSCQLVVARCDGSKVLEFVKEALDEIALGVEGIIARTWVVALGHGWNHRGDTARNEGISEPVRIEGLVAD